MPQPRGAPQGSGSRGPSHAERGTPMKWYFALNAASLENDSQYEWCVDVAVLSALQHTSLHPHLLFDGEPCALTERLQRLGATVVFHRSSLFEAINAARPGETGWQTIAHGAFLRIDIPQLDLESEFVLYTDCDVMFQREPTLAGIEPRYFAVAPEFTIGDYAKMNTGVMVINLAGMRGVSLEFDGFIRNGLANFPAYDQGALREFFRDKYDHLPERLNWKPYWGSNPAAEIIHFHGPKPTHVRRMLTGALDGFPPVLVDLFSSNIQNYAALDGTWHAYLDRMRTL